MNTGIAFDDVTVVRADELVLRCQLQGKTVSVGRLQIMPGTTVDKSGDRGRLVIPRWAVRDLGLTEPAQ